jgi:hypothetical protein
MIENIKNIKEDLKKQYNDLLKLVPDAEKPALKEKLNTMIQEANAENPNIFMSEFTKEIFG